MWPVELHVQARRVTACRAELTLCLMLKAKRWDRFCWSSVARRYSWQFKFENHFFEKAMISCWLIFSERRSEKLFLIIGFCLKSERFWEARFFVFVRNPKTKKCFLLFCRWYMTLRWSNKLGMWFCFIMT